MSDTGNAQRQREIADMIADECADDTVIDVVAACQTIIGRAALLCDNLDHALAYAEASHKDVCAMIKQARAH